MIKYGTPKIDKRKTQTDIPTKEKSDTKNKTEKTDKAQS